MTWSDKLGDLRTLLEELDSRLDAAHEDIDSRIEAAHAKAAEAIRIAQTLLDALTPDTDTEIPA